jgi:hypothetical protein
MAAASISRLARKCWRLSVIKRISNWKTRIGEASAAEIAARECVLDLPLRPIEADRGEALYYK